jgi:hypothetical protein
MTFFHFIWGIVALFVLIVLLNEMAGKWGGRR